MTSPKNLLIVGLCLVVAGMLIALLFRPVPPPVLIGKLTTEQENELRATIVTLEGQNDSLRRELDKSKAAGKTAQEAFNSEIKAKVKTIAELKDRPVVVQLVQENPELDSLHQAYDSSMVAYEGRTIALTMEMQTRDRIAQQLIQNFEQRIAETEKLLADRDAEIAELQGENKKLRRKLVWTKIGGVIFLGAVVALSL